jgi:cytochrome c heme-lyase
MECPVKKDDKRGTSSMEASAVPQAESKCPVGGSSKASSTNVSGSGGGMFSFLWGNNPSTNTTNPTITPTNGNGNDSGSSGDGITGYNTAANDMAFSQVQRRPGQKEMMSTKRTLSNIPKSDFTPTHQPNIPNDKSNNNLWVYPSEQQYYNAMKNKGYSPPEKDISAILAIHNSVNERGWEEVVEWEAFRGFPKPRLKRFEGRPKDFTPKAKFMMNFLGLDPPFDRHDWYVERDDGKEVRYIIDFYHVPNKRNLPVHMDIRPALDSPSAFIDRIVMQYRKVFQPSTLPGYQSISDTSPPTPTPAPAKTELTKK